MIFIKINVINMIFIRSLYLKYLFKTFQKTKLTFLYKIANILRISFHHPFTTRSIRLQPADGG